MHSKIYKYIFSFIIFLVGVYLVYYMRIEHPVFNQPVSKILVYKGDIVLPGQNPLVIIDANNEDGSQIIHLLKSGSKSRRMVKFPSKYCITMLSEDDAEYCHVRIGENFIKLHIVEKNQLSLFVINRHVSKSLCAIFERLGEGEGVIH